MKGPGMHAASLVVPIISSLAQRVTSHTTGSPIHQNSPHSDAVVPAWHPLCPAVPFWHVKVRERLFSSPSEGLHWPNGSTQTCASNSRSGLEGDKDSLGAIAVRPLQANYGLPYSISSSFQNAQWSVWFQVSPAPQWTGFDTISSNRPRRGQWG